MNNSDVSVIIMGFNSEEQVKSGFVKSIAERSLVPCYEVNVVFYDNGSGDKTISLLKEQKLSIDIIGSTYNRLYCQGNNLAIQYAYQRFSSRFFLIIDSDMEVQEGYLEPLVYFMEKNCHVGIIQSLTYRLDEKSTLYSAGHIFNEEGICFPSKQLPPILDSPFEVKSCSLTATLIRREVFETIGLLEPLFEIYWESIDLSFRARKAGFKCYCHPSSICYTEGNIHKGYQHFNYYYVHRNHLAFWARHDPVFFQKIRKKALLELKDINTKLKKKRFLSDPIEVNRYRALIDGLKLAKFITWSKPVQLNKFKKRELVIYQITDG